ncbi:MAG: UDP-4-amino-4,6-dideoxy-N-acetyl-beta-L-altrosamine transaminase [Pseudomonadota bacterium]
MTVGSGSDFLPYGRHSVDADDEAAVLEVLRSGWLTQGPAVERFEKALCQTTGAAHAVALNSGTAALHLALLAAGIGPGDRAVVPAVTFLATANAVRLAGGEVIFADVDPETGLMGAAQLDQALERAGGLVKAVLPVHLTGQCCDMEAILPLAERVGAVVIDDACHALGGAVRRGGDLVPVGGSGLAAMTAFSFHPVKAIAMGEGGAVTTEDAQLAAHIRRLRSHGMSRESFACPDQALDPRGAPNPWYYEMAEVGLNYRAADLNCALATSQLGKLRRFIDRRAALADRYDRLLAPLAPLIRPNPRVSWSRQAWHLYAVAVDFIAAGIDRGAVMRAMAAQGVGSQVHYLPVCHQPYYRARYGTATVPGADQYYARTLSLPLFVDMRDEDVDRVVEVLSRALGGADAA